MGKEDRRESFLNNLGRATRRGVRQCKKCGTLNGTRGYSCKNKSCDVVFKEAGEKRKLSTEACRIETGNTNIQVFSVRVRDKGPDYRGFVQLDCHMNNNSNSNNVQLECHFNSDSSSDCRTSQNFQDSFNSNDPLNASSQYSVGNSASNIITELERNGLSYTSSSVHFDGHLEGGSGSLESIGEFSETAITLSMQHRSLLSASAGMNSSATTKSSTAHCFVDSCHKLNKSLQKGICSHIKAALQCFKNSESVMLKNSVLNSMPLHPELKTDIWQLATGTPGPLVQRVSKNIMVVKCQTEPLHPLGFLHFSFQSIRNCRDGGKFFCSCRAFKTSNNLLKDVMSLQGSGAASSLMPVRRCIHLYACLLALSSHAHLAQEFSQYIRLIAGDRDSHKTLCNGPVSAVGSTAMEEDDDDDTPGTVNIQVTEEDGEDESGETTSYIRLSEAGSCTSDDSLGREGSYLILNDSGEPQCQVEVEVLQDDPTPQLLRALDSHHQHTHGRGTGGSSALITQDLEGKLEIQLHTSDDGGLELCTSDGGTISVRACPSSSSFHSPHLTTISSGGPAGDGVMHTYTTSPSSAVQRHGHHSGRGSSVGGVNTSFASSLCSDINSVVFSAGNGAGCEESSHDMANVVPKSEDPAVTQASSALLTLHKTNSTLTKINKKVHQFSRLNRRGVCRENPVDENSAGLSFQLWLAGATERVNHTMQYAAPGTPPALVFHVPRVFFQCLLDRIHHHSRKKIPSYQSSVPNVDPSIPGHLTRLSWHLHNLTHVRAVFHTPYVTLQTMRSFLLNRDGTYQLYHPHVDHAALVSSSRGSTSQPLIRPQEYRTVLKVGTSGYQPAGKATPFVIEWIQDVFPLSKMGELRIKFEYEHIHNGVLVKNVPFREVVSTPSNSLTTPVTLFRNPFIINSASIHSNSPQTVNVIKTEPSTKHSPPPIAPKITVVTQMKESPTEETSSAVLDISLPHETFGDTDGYPALLF